MYFGKEPKILTMLVPVK